ncbi:MAG TPA: hypothetical protein VGQ37_11410 [Vicinamibacterales bacterium]|jgi:hypothetical protein|nr:hypothetical protein [Vicinamibacterales bacterium]
MVSLLIAGALAAQTRAQPQQPAEPPLVDMPRRVLEMTGASPRECGRYPLRQANGRLEGATSEQLEASVQCVREAIKAGQPFWTFVEHPGIDSWVANGFLRTASGDVHYFVYDSAPCGRPGCQPKLTLLLCQLPSVKRNGNGNAVGFDCP